MIKPFDQVTILNIKMCSVLIGLASSLSIHRY